MTDRPDDAGRPAAARLDRKQFFGLVGRLGLGTCMCAAAGEMGVALGAETTPKPVKPAAASQPGEKSPARDTTRMKFVDEWVPRFFGVMDETLDEPARRKLMSANGKACFSAFARDMPRRSEPASMERIVQWVNEKGKARGYSMEGEVIHFMYVGSAETGQSSPERICLCPLVEAQSVKTMSPTFCHCSTGYVKEMHDRVFGRPVNVELVDSVLKGGQRCRFRITLD